MMDAGEHEAVGHIQNELVTRLPGRVEPLEWLVEFYSRTSDSFRLPDALAKLGDTLAAAGKFDRAKATFEQLLERQPENEAAKRKLDSVLRKMGLLAKDAGLPEPEDSFRAEIPPAPAAKIERDDVPFAQPGGDKTPAPAPSSSEASLDEETQKFIAQSLTDVDLFASYGLTQKAIGLLEAILRRAPRHTPTLEKLLDFVLGAGDDRRTAELAAQLERIHRERGDAPGAERFGELRRRFQRAAGLSDEEMAAAANPSAAVSVAAEEAVEDEEPLQELPVPVEEASIAEVAPPPVPPQKSAPPAPPVHEVDLSDEWASLLEQSAPSSAPPAKPAAPPPSKATPPAPPTPEPATPKEWEISEFEIPIETPAV